MTNITKTINNYLLDNITTDFDQIFNDLFPTTDGDCLISRHDPSSARETEYIDGSAVGNVMISYYMRSDSAESCRSVLTSIVDGLDGLNLDDTDDGINLNLTVQTLPQFVSVDDKENVIYTITVSVKYKRIATIGE